jgi:TetR/AcrR family transcriptional regulator, transcriptional repressor of bet genes
MPKIVDHDVRREQLAASACEAIAESGIDNAGLIQIARSAGFTTGALTHYFPGRDALLVAALRHAMKSTSARIEMRLSSNPPDYFLALCEALPIHPIATRVNIVWYHFWMRSLSDSGIRKVQSVEHANWAKQVRGCVLGLTKGVVSLSKQEMEDEVEDLISFINGIGIRAVLDPRDWPPSRQIERLRRYLVRVGLMKEGRTARSPSRTVAK